MPSGSWMAVYVCIHLKKQRKEQRRSSGYGNNSHTSGKIVAPTLVSAPATTMHPISSHRKGTSIATGTTLLTCPFIFCSSCMPCHSHPFHKSRKKPVKNGETNQNNKFISSCIQFAVGFLWQPSKWEKKLHTKYMYIRTHTN